MTSTKFFAQQRPYSHPGSSPNHCPLSLNNNAQPYGVSAAEPTMLDDCNFTLDDYDICCKTGAGSTSIVYTGRHKEWGIPVAIKVIEKSTIGNNNNNQNKSNVSGNDEKSKEIQEKAEVAQQPIKARSVVNEVKMMKKMKHQNIIQIFDVIETECYTAIVMELAGNGSLDSFIRPNVKMAEDQLFRFFFPIVLAIDYLHNMMHVAHRDIKAENVLLDSDFNVKLSDFGFCLSLDTNPLMNTRCGSPMYVSPEIIVGKPYNEKTDIWSMGVLLHSMACGQFPFVSENIQQLFKKILNQDLSYLSILNISESLKDLISGMLTKEADQRFSINDVLKSEWIQEMLLKTNYSCYNSLNLTQSGSYSCNHNISLFDDFNNEYMHELEMKDKKRYKACMRMLNWKAERRTEIRSIKPVNSINSIKSIKPIKSQPFSIFRPVVAMVRKQSAQRVLINKIPPICMPNLAINNM